MRIVKQPSKKCPFYSISASVDSGICIQCVFRETSKGSIIEFGESFECSHPDGEITVPEKTINLCTVGIMPYTCIMIEWIGNNRICKADDNCDYKEEYKLTKQKGEK